MKLKCKCPECESELDIEFSGNPKDGFSDIKETVTKKGDKKPDKEDKEKDELSKWY